MHEEEVNRLHGKFASVMLHVNQSEPEVFVDPDTSCFFDARVETPGDVADLERSISRVLRGEEGRCGLLLSAAYQRLKFDVLYGTERVCRRVNLGRVRLVLDEGKRVQAFYA
jgi:hypothetical protein